MDLYLHAVIDLGYEYGGSVFYDYHRSFTARAAGKLAQFQTSTNWSIVDTELLCPQFAGRRSPLCAVSFRHTENWFCNMDARRSLTFPSTSSAAQGMPAPMQHPQVDKLGQPIQLLGKTPICNNFNYGTCSFNQCQLLHICVSCCRAHPKSTCTLKRPSSS